MTVPSPRPEPGADRPLHHPRGSVTAQGTEAARPAGSVVVRELAAADDPEAVGRVLRAGYEAAEADHPHEVDHEYLDEIAAVGARREDTVVVVAELDGRVVGCLTYLADHTNPYAEHDDPGAASFRYTAVDPAAQGRGAGRALVTWAIERARADGRHRVRIHTQAHLRAALRLYDSMGFVRDPSRDEPDWGGVAFVLHLDTVR
jgi:ribosomal protein S18 acetylase RimI-like enzyme